VQRVSVVGNSGSGKTTLARQLAGRLGVAHVELDAIFHQPDWQELPAADFRAAVQEFVEQPGWVVDGNYSTVQDIVWARADTVIVLDLPRSLVMRRVARRTLGRLLLRRELWNGNREPWSNVLSVDPQRSILAWAWTRHHTYQERFAQAQVDPANAHLQFLVLHSRRDVRSVVAAAGPAAT
jgi:adenylate kinase family enzyme